MPRPCLLACLLGVVIAGPMGCASQQSASFPGDPAMSAQLPPLDVNPGLEPLPAASVSSNPAHAPTLIPTLGDTWPRQVAMDNATALVYLPQVNSWEGNTLSFRAAVSVKKSGSNDATFGVVWGTARTSVDRLTRTVMLGNLSLSQVRFPTLADDGLAYLQELRKQLPPVMATMSLDLLQGELAASQTVKFRAVQVNNDPPRVIVSNTPAILVPIDGAPSIQAVPNTRFERVINTQALIIRTRRDNTWYIHVFDGWLSASSLEGPWAGPASAPFGLDDLARQLAKKGSVDLLDGGPQAAAVQPAGHVGQLAHLRGRDVAQGEDHRGPAISGLFLGAHVR